MGAKLRDKDLTERVSINIVKLLNRENKTAYRLARDIGLTDGSISAFKSGASLPSLSTAIRIAESLNCTLEDLVK